MDKFETPEGPLGTPQGRASFHALSDNNSDEKGFENRHGQSRRIDAGLGAARSRAFDFDDERRLVFFKGDPTYVQDIAAYKVFRFIYTEDRKVTRAEINGLRGCHSRPDLILKKLPTFLRRFVGSSPGNGGGYFFQWPDEELRDHAQ